jgi:DNA-binding IclR family transcriptional regulator
MTRDTLSTTTQRLLAIIKLLADQPDGCTAQEMLTQLGGSRSTLFELLRALKELGLVQQFEKRGRYRAGARLQAWLVEVGRAARSPLAQDIRSAFYAETIDRDPKETLLLVELQGNCPVVLAQVEGSEVIRSAYPLGEPLSDALTAAGVMLRTEPPAEVVAQGYALKLESDRIELAVPICADGIHPGAALVLSAPAFRWQPAGILTAWLPALREMAAHCSYRLGAPLYAPFEGGPEREVTLASPLAQPEMTSFLGTPLTARLACIRPDGHPHVIPVWQEWDGRGFTVLALRGSQWAEYLLANPNVSLSIDEPWQPFRRVAARGQAQPLPFEPGSPELAALLERFSRRYLGEGSGSLLQGQVLRAFSILPDVLRGWQGLPVSV